MAGHTVATALINEGRHFFGTDWQPLWTAGVKTTARRRIQGTGDLSGEDEPFPYEDFLRLGSPIVETFDDVITFGGG